MVLMDGILLSVILLIAGLAILIKGSDFFVESAAYIARHFGVSELIIGLTLVSMGTSLPELGASVYAAYNGNGGIAVGNVVGSNIANIALVLGAVLLLKQLTVKKKMLSRDGLVMMMVSLIFIMFIITENSIARWEGLVLMAIFAVYIYYLYRQNKVEKLTCETTDVCDQIEPKKSSLGKESFLLIVGCIGVIIGAKLLVDSAVDIADHLNISQTVIGSTLIAFGTSVPELAVSLTAILRKHGDISIGNILGSNIFNILWVIGAAAIVAREPLAVDNILIRTNIPIMLMVAALLLIFMAIGNKLKRWQGGVFIAIYAIFLVLNFT
jgi:cation:H+ antiporter